MGDNKKRDSDKVNKAVEEKRRFNWWRYDSKMIAS